VVQRTCRLGKSIDLILGFNNLRRIKCTLQVLSRDIHKHLFSLPLNKHTTPTVTHTGNTHSDSVKQTARYSKTKTRILSFTLTMATHPQSLISTKVRTLTHGCPFSENSHEYEIAIEVGKGFTLTLATNTDEALLHDSSEDEGWSTCRWSKDDFDVCHLYTMAGDSESSTVCDFIDVNEIEPIQEQVSVQERLDSVRRDNEFGECINDSLLRSLRYSELDPHCNLPDPSTLEAESLECDQPLDRDAMMFQTETNSDTPLSSPPFHHVPQHQQQLVPQSNLKRRPVTESVQTLHRSNRVRLNPDSSSNIRFKDSQYSAKSHHGPVDTCWDAHHCEVASSVQRSRSSVSWTNTTYTKNFGHPDKNIKIDVAPPSFRTQGYQPIEPKVVPQDTQSLRSSSTFYSTLTLSYPLDLKQQNTAERQQKLKPMSPPTTHKDEPRHTQNAVVQSPGCKSCLRFIMDRMADYMLRACHPGLSKPSFARFEKSLRADYKNGGGRTSSGSGQERCHFCSDLKTKKPYIMGQRLDNLLTDAFVCQKIRQSWYCKTLVHDRDLVFAAQKIVSDIATTPSCTKNVAALFKPIVETIKARTQSSFVVRAKEKHNRTKKSRKSKSLDLLLLEGISAAEATDGAERTNRLRQVCQIIFDVMG